MRDVLRQSEAASVRDGPPCGEGNGDLVRSGACPSWGLTPGEMAASDPEIGGITLTRRRFQIGEGKLPRQTMVKPGS